MDASQWDGSKRPFTGPCGECGAVSLFMEGKIEEDGPQVYVFCEKCDFRQSMISREPLSKAELELALQRARELGLA